ncbi:ribosome-binding protein 1 isoform X1 [Aplysia californica]|uniref:Ribosome-binding protein 1 isoform X1 n=1 Tax=Aplysia californica TaxID=6500 RepID=A0ABM1VPX8_APLCA|nr:ribosome-binding protein 1 isoform X1 [Aplysia californica]XP_035824470.1 ribosome-binding protein 1 isoform X1 [Aplysia californica]
MEIITILIGVAVFIISALMIYCISAFSMREKTFEEVMEEQKRRQEEEREKAKAEKKAEKEQHKKKYKKGKQEKVKEKSAQVTEPELKVEHKVKMVNLEIEPEIIERTESLGLNAGLRQRGKRDKSSKSILHNKDEIAPVADKTVEMRHKQVAPKDELELKKAHEKVVVEKIEKVKAVQQQQEVKESRQKHSMESKENLPPKKNEETLKQPKGTPKGTPVKQNIAEQDKRSNKIKSDDVQLNGSQLISSVKTAKLSDEELQALIEILLNRQGLAPSSPVNQAESWNKKSQKGDPMSLLKRQLEEKERALQEEQNLAMSANSKVKELRNELGTEKTKYTALEKRFQEKVSHQQAELDALQQRMQHTHEQHLMETNGLQARLRQVEQGGGGGGGDQAAVQKLSAENKILQETLSLKAKENVSLNEKVKNFEKDLNNSNAKLLASETARKSAETKVSTSEEKIRKLEGGQKGADAMINKRVEEVAIQLRKSESRNDSLSSDLQNATSALSTAEAEVSTLKGKLQELETHLSRADASKEVESKLQESERKRSDLEGNVKNLEKQLADLSRRLSESETEMLRLQQENRSLVDENKTISERVQAAPAANGDIHEQNGPSLSMEEHERIVKEKSEEVTALTANLEGQKKATANLQVQVDTQTAQVSELQQQLAQQKAKNNELREKNWKAMEALEKAEKSSAEKADKALKSAREMSSAGSVEIETNDKAVFQRLFPEVKVSDKLAHKEWVVAFEKQALKKLQSSVNEDSYKTLEEENKKFQLQITKYEAQSTELNSKSARLQEAEKELSQLKSKKSSQVDSAAYSQIENDNERLKEEVEQYRSIVSETENKLKQLEKSIDAEEKKWKEKLKAAESSSSKNSGSVQRIAELEKIIADQEKQMQEYRNVLSLTENSLKQLESKVATEENAWQGKVNSSQSQLVQTQEELTNLKKQLLDSRGSEELPEGSMQTKVETLEEELRESQEKIIVLTSEKETVITKVMELEKTTTSGSSDKEVEELRSQVQVERKKNKDLSLNVVKLNGIIKTGQDALSQEQELVKKLQEQLDYKSVKSGVSESEEIEQAASSTDNGTSV